MKRIWLLAAGLSLTAASAQAIIDGVAEVAFSCLPRKLRQIIREIYRDCSFSLLNLRAAERRAAIALHPAPTSRYVREPIKSRSP